MTHKRGSTGYNFHPAKRAKMAARARQLAAEWSRKAGDGGDALVGSLPVERD